MRTPATQWLGRLTSAALLLAAAAPAASAQATIQFFAGRPTSQPTLGGAFTTPSATPFCTTSLAAIDFPSAAAFDAFVSANCGPAGAGFTGFDFGARIVGNFVTGSAGIFNFTGTTDDGFSLFINGTSRVSMFGDQATGLNFFTPLDAGDNQFQLDYFANTGGTSFLTLSAQGVALAPLATSTVPEPATVALFATGLLGLAGVARRRSRTTS